MFGIATTTASFLFPTLALARTAQPQACEALRKSASVTSCANPDQLMIQIASGKRQFEDLWISGTIDFGKVKSYVPRLVFIRCIFQNAPKFGTSLRNTQLAFIETSVRNHPNRFIPVPSSAIVNSLLKGADVTLSGMALQGELQLLGSASANSVGQDRLSSRASVMGTLNLENCLLPDGLDLDEAVIEAVRIHGSRISKLLAVSGSTIRNDILLTEDQFDSPVVLLRTKIGGHLLLNGSEFSGLAVEDLDAEGYIELSGTHLRPPNEFPRPSSESPFAQFTRCTARGFHATNLSSEGLLQITESQIPGDISLSGHTERMSIQSSNVGRVYLADLRFSKTLSLSNTLYKVVYFDWSVLGRQFKPTVADLMQLEATYLSVGDYPRANEVYYLRKQVQNRYPLPAPFRIVNFVFVDLSTGYGVRPLRILPYSLAVVLIFALIFSHPRALSPKANQPDFAKLSFVGRLIESVHFSLEWFFRLPSTDWEPSRARVQLVRLRLPKAFPVPALTLSWRLFQWIAYCEALLGWFLLALFIATAMRAGMH